MTHTTENALEVRSPRQAALSARQRSDGDPVILAWEAAFWEAIQPLRNDGGWQFLQAYVLAPGDWSALLSMKASWPALRLLDRWCPTDFVSILSTAESIPSPPTAVQGSNQFYGAYSEYPLLAMLSQEHLAWGGSGLQVIKALLLLAMLRGSLLTTSDAVSECSDGIRKCITEAAWWRIAPWDELKLGDDLATTLDHVQELVREATKPLLAKRSTVYLSFLQKLSTVLEGLRSGAYRLPASTSMVFASDPDEEGGARPERQIHFLQSELAPPIQSDVGSEVSIADSAYGAGEAGEPIALAGADERSASLCGETDAHEQFRASVTGFRAAITNQYLTVDHDQLLPHELRTLVDHLRTTLRGVEQKSRRAAAMLSLSLVTGETLTSLAETMVEPTFRPGLTRDGFWVRVVRSEPNARQPNDAQRELLAPHGDRFQLALPKELEAYFSEVLGHATPGHRLAEALGTVPKQLIAEAHEFLAGIRHRVSRLLVGKLARWLPTALYATCHDAVKVHLLTAVEADPPLAGAYYYACNAVELQKLHRQVVLAAWRDGVSTPEQPKFRVGSWWYLTARELRRLYKNARKSLLGRIRNRSLSLQTRHRAHQALSVLNLLLTTGGRPVEDFGDSLDMFDLEAQIGVFDDKSGGPAHGHRIVALAPPAVEQLRAQCSYLRALTAELRGRASATARAIKSIVDHPERRIGPLFFDLDTNLRICSLTPSKLREELEGVWPLPLNFARHWLSTELRERGASAETVASFLGHVNVGTQNLSSIGLQAVEAHYAPMRPLLDAAVADAGVQPVPGWLDGAQAPEEDQGLVAMVRPLFPFGHERRSAEREQEQEGIDGEINSFLDEALNGAQLETLSNEAVSLLFKRLRDLTSNTNTYRGVRLRQALRERLARLAKKHQTGWSLPSVEVPIADFAIRVEHTALRASSQTARLRQCLVEELKSQASSASAEQRTGVLALALAAEALVLDSQVLEEWAQLPKHDLINIPGRDDPQSRTWWIRFVADSSGVRQFALPEWLAAKLSHHDGKWMAVDRDQVRAQIDRFAEKYSLTWMTGGLDVAVRTVRSAAALRLSGLAHSFAAGEHGSVSLPRQAIERLVSGKPLPATLAALAKKQAEPMQSETDLVAGEHDAAHTAVATTLDGVTKFIAMVSKGFADVQKLSVGNDEGMAPGRTRVDALGRLISARFAALQVEVAVPAICGHLAQWLCAMCRKGRSKGGMYSLRTVTTYWSAIAKRLIEHVDIENVALMDAVEIEELYVDVLEFANTEQLQHVETALRVFHGFLRKCHGVPPIDWRPIRAIARGEPGRVDANLIAEDEYLQALALLMSDPEVEPRRRLMNAAILVLCYRVGLRISEAMGLRRKDIQFVGGVWIIRVTGNLYRRLKSDTSMRIVPILEPLSPAEHKALQDWLRHADLYHDGRETTALFTRSATVRSMMPRGRVGVRLRDALMTATGDPQIRVHHCRHSLPNRLMAAALGLQRGASVHMQTALREWCEPQVLLGVLTQEAVPTRRLIWAIASIMGHTPRTLLRSYWHLGGELLSVELKSSWWPEVLPAINIQSHAEVRRFELRWGVRPAEVQTLGPETARPLSPDAVDDVLDLLRQHGRADGVAAATLVSEEHIQAVAQAAAALAEQARGEYAERSGWWLIARDARYERGQVLQVRDALSRLEADLEREGVSSLQLTTLGKHIDESQNMLVTGRLSEMLEFAGILALLVDDAKNVEVVLPTAALKTSDPSGQSAFGAVFLRKRGRPTKGSAPGPLAVGDDAWAEWLKQIESAGYSHIRRAHLMASRQGGANRKVRQIRVGLRIRQNTRDRVRDSRVGMRVLLAAAVWRTVIMKESRRAEPAGS